VTSAKRFFRNPTSVLGLFLVVMFVIVALAAPWIAPPRPGQRDAYVIPKDGFAMEPNPPSAKHIFGTTEGQFDVFYGVVWGTRTAFEVGVIITGCTVVIGLTVGSIAAFYGGWVDELLMRIVELFMAFPYLLAALTMSAVLQARLGRGILTGMLALIMFGWTSYARLIRGDILTVKERDYILAARAVGAPNRRILVRHIIPNAIFSVMVTASMDIGSYVLNFAALSFLGLGAQVGYADWGQLISFARNWIPALSKHWHIVVFPGGAILLFVLGWNLMGDALRDVLDPRLRGSKG
jgi:peptide/nickel transport system permease protein